MTFILGRRALLKREVVRATDMATKYYKPDLKVTEARQRLSMLTLQVA